MKCRRCGSLRTHVLRSDPQPGLEEIRRRRGCHGCGHRWTTYEIALPRPLLEVLRGFGEIEIQVLAEKARERRRRDGGLAVESPVDRAGGDWETKHRQRVREERRRQV